MKTSLLVSGLLVLSVSGALAQHLNSAQIVGGSVLHGSGETPEQFRQLALANELLQEQQARVAAQKTKIQLIYSKDPWRAINGTTNFVGGDGWLEFQGLPQQVLNEGTIFKGKCGAILTVCPVQDSTHQTFSQDALGSQSYAQKRTFSQNAAGNESYSQRTSQSASHVVADTSFSHLFYGSDIFLVANFPYPSTQPYEGLLAYDSGYYTYTDPNGQVVTVHKLDYGRPCTKLWSPGELAEAKAKADAKKQAVTDRVLKSNQDLADNGDAYGLLRMGERYRDGEGVTKDLAKAREYLARAAAAGSPTATDDLKKLPASQN